MAAEAEELHGSQLFQEPAAAGVASLVEVGAPAAVLTMVLAGEAAEAGRNNGGTDQVNVAGFGSGRGLVTISFTPSATLKLSADPSQVWANGHKKATLTATLTDANGLPVSGETIALTSDQASCVTPGQASCVTISPPSAQTADGTNGTTIGTAVFTATSTVIPVDPNTGQEVPVRFTAADANDPNTTAKATVDYQPHKVLVLIQGINTELQCGPNSQQPQCSPPLPTPSFPVLGLTNLEGILRSLYGFGPCDIIWYSYGGGSVDPSVPCRYGQGGYSPNTTAQGFDFDIEHLRNLVEDFGGDNPNTQFYLVGHSQGGLIAFQELGYLSALPQNGTSIKAIFTLDSPLGGAPWIQAVWAAMFPGWGNPAFGQLVQIDQSTALSENQGDAAEPACAFGFVIATARCSGFSNNDDMTRRGAVNVYTYGNTNDPVYNPRLCGIAPGALAPGSNVNSQIVTTANSGSTGLLTLDFFQAGLNPATCAGQNHGAVLLRPLTMKPTTSLSSVSSPGATEVSVASIVGFNVGDSVTIGAGGANTEVRTVIGRISDPGSLFFSTPLLLAHSAGESVVRQPTPNPAYFANIAASIGGQFSVTATNLSSGSSPGATEVSVASAAGFNVGDTVTIGAGGANAEVRTVTGFGSLKLNKPLLFAHAAEESIIRLPSPLTDTASPTTIAALSASSNTAGWINSSPLTATLVAQDHAGGTGVASSYYALDNSSCAPPGAGIPIPAVCQTGTSVTVSGDGRHTLYFFSVDAAGNFEAQQQQAINIDVTPPTSQVASLPVTESSASFQVQWSGTDAGAGIQDFSVYFSQDGGPFTVWLANTTDTSATFTGQPGSTYAFYSIARDQAGNIENTKSVGDTSTKVTPAAVFFGHIALPSRPSPPDASWQIPLQVSFLQPGTNTVVLTTSPTTDLSGGFSVPGMSPGIYDVKVKYAPALSKLATSKALVSGDNPVLDFGMLAVGDVNNDDAVDLLDFSALRTTFGKCAGDAGYDARADLNGDGCVDLLDFSLLRANFGRVGPQPAP